MTPLAQKLIHLGACHDVIEWLGDRNAEQAWAECERGDWMAQIVAEKCNRKAVAMCLCEIVRTVLHLIPQGEDRPRVAIETLEAWARGEATIEQVRDAACNAANAAVDAISYEAFSAASAARSASAIAYVCTPNGSRAVAFAACAAARVRADRTAARYAALAMSADIVRRHFPTCPLNGDDQ